MDNGALIIWIVVMVAFLIIEAVSFQLITIWFALGALAAIIANLFGATNLVQFLIFISVSAVALAISRPLLKKHFKKKSPQKVNADSCIGSEAIVIQEIDNDKASGQVNCKGVIWTARSGTGNIIEKDQKVLIKSIEGVKVIVESIDQQ